MPKQQKSLIHLGMPNKYHICLYIYFDFRPNAILNPAAHEEAMIAVVSVPNSENILVCSKSSSAYLLTIEGNLIRSFSPNIGPNIGFTAITISPRGTIHS